MFFSTGVGSSSSVSHSALTVRGPECVEISSPSTKATEQSQGLGVDIIYKMGVGIHACVCMHAYYIKIYGYMYSKWRGKISRLSTWKVSIKCINVLYNLR